MWRNMNRTLKYLLAAALLFLPSRVRTEDVPNGTGGPKRLYLDMTKQAGYWDYFDSINLPPGSAKYLRNLDFTINGQLTTRNGISTIYNGTPDGGGYHEAYSRNNLDVFTSTTNNNWFIWKIGNRYQWGLLSNFAGINGYSPCLNWPNGGVTNSVRSDGINWNGAYYVDCEDGSTPTKILESSAGSALYFVNVSSIPAGSILQKHLDRLLIAGNTTSVNTIFYSEPNQPESFPAQNTITLTGLSQSDKIIAMGPVMQAILPVCTQNTFKYLSGTVFPSSLVPTAGNIAVRPVSDNIGCLSPKANKILDGELYFPSMGPDQVVPGIYRFNGVSVEEVTKGQRNFFKNTLTMNNPSKTVVGFINKDLYCIAASTVGGFNNDCLVCVDKGGSTYIRQFSTSPMRISSDTLAIDGAVGFNGILYAVSGSTISSYSTQKFQIYELEQGREDFDRVTSLVDYPLPWR